MDSEEFKKEILHLRNLVKIRKLLHTYLFTKTKIQNVIIKHILSFCVFKRDSKKDFKKLLKENINKY